MGKEVLWKEYANGLKVPYVAPSDLDASRCRTTAPDRNKGEYTKFHTPGRLISAAQDDPEYTTMPSFRQNPFMISLMAGSFHHSGLERTTTGCKIIPEDQVKAIDLLDQIRMIRSEGEANRTMPNRASAGAAKSNIDRMMEKSKKRFHRGDPAVHSATHQRVTVIQTNVGKSRNGGPIHLVATRDGDRFKVPEHNLQSF